MDKTTTKTQDEGHRGDLYWKYDQEWNPRLVRTSGLVREAVLGPKMQMWKHMAGLRLSA